MTQEVAKKWLERRGYKVVYQMGLYPDTGYYIVIPRGNWGSTKRGTLNGIVKEIKREEHYKNW